jgi:hypothetical protein
MAISEPAVDRLAPIVEEVARAIGRHAIKPGGPMDAPGHFHIERENGVRRVVQVYWTPFEALVPGESIGLHLDVAEPRVHWAECYLTPDYRNWVFCFREREDGEVELAYHGDYATPQEALKSFFDLSAWYVLAATEITWDDVVYEVADDVGWSEHYKALTGSSVGAAIQESLKKSTILWLRWDTDEGEITMPVWFIYYQDKIYVLSGERQQTLPGAEEMRQATVILRWKGKNAQVAELPASVRVVEPGPEWDEIAERIAEKRLNIPGLPEETARRWRDECVILELTLLN